MLIKDWVILFPRKRDLNECYLPPMYVHSTIGVLSFTRSQENTTEGEWPEDEEDRLLLAAFLLLSDEDLVGAS